MSEGGDDINERSENHVEDAEHKNEKSNNTNPPNIGDPDENNVLSSNTHDQLMQMVVDLNLQNEYLKSHFQDLKNVHTNSACSLTQEKTIDQDTTELHEKLEALNAEIVIERQTRGAAEAALEHLRVEYSEADAKSQELAAKLAEAQMNLEQVKERDEKNYELARTTIAINNRT